MSQFQEDEIGARRSRTLLGHLAPGLVSLDEPTNRLEISLTSSSSQTTTVRIGDVSLAVPRPPHGLAHCVPALYLAGKGQVSLVFEFNLDIYKRVHSHLSSKGLALRSFRTGSGRVYSGE